MSPHFSLNHKMTVGPIDRHRSSIEGVIFPKPQQLVSEQHNKATNLFNRIIDQFEPLQVSDNYKPITLLRLTKEGVSAKDDFLVFFFTFIEHDRLGVAEEKDISLAEILSNLHNFQGWTPEEGPALEQSLVKFARFLVDNFFLPLKSSATKTPQPTPASLHHLDLSESAIGTTQRVSGLRQTCLERDRHRCVITRRFDTKEAEARNKIDRGNVKDDDGNSLIPEIGTTARLEVAHIIPHSLMSLKGEPEKSRSPIRFWKCLTPMLLSLLVGLTLTDR
ncbi:hypothetical protein BJX63DRAFT_317913 [Aspergillus granulosus]|uniref:HNH nuclease domain-containing protein n=1 Tax=Aspergillus granulosus TaxID=176169 RepID=A0ABR4H4J8_9EURO